LISQSRGLGDVYKRQGKEEFILLSVINLIDQQVLIKMVN
jgi:hypothetical protein